LDKSLIVACDCDLVTYEKILETTGDLEKVGAYKIGFELGLQHSLQRVVEITRHYTGKPLIYDHQAAGTDISEIGKRLMGITRDVGFDSIIFKPRQNKIANFREHIKFAHDFGLEVMAVGKMTDEEDSSYRDIGKMLDIYKVAAEEGVLDFCVPGNDIKFLDVLKSEHKNENAVYYPIGIGIQGGKIEAVLESLDGSSVHPIVGRSIYAAQSIRQATLKLISKL